MNLREWCIENNRNDLLLEWDIVKNKELGYTPNSIPFTFRTKVHWICEKGHPYLCTVYHKTRSGVKCPVCLNMKIIKGINDLATLYPNIAAEWDESNEKSPTEYAPKSGIKVKWRCKLGHIYESKIIDRVNKEYGCPICSNHQVLVGFNDLASQRPDLLREWDYLKNDKKPDEIIYSTQIKYYWICDKGHSYMASVYNRSNGTGCPYCLNQEILIGYNDFQSQNPELMKEWNFEKNNKLGIKPTEITSKSTKKVWWKCKKDGYEWETTPYRRVEGKGCPVCANRVVIKGINDLATTHPNIAKMYHPTKNKKSVYEITYGSPQKYWWLCEKGHEWETSPNMLSSGKGCPHCSNHISIPQAVLYLSINKKFKNMVQLYRINKTEFDIFIPELNLLIEYDGWIWHKDKHEFDFRKEKLAKEKGFNFLRVWEYKEADNIEVKSNKNILYYNVTKGYNYKYLCELFYMYLNKFYNLNIPTNIKYTSNEIELAAREYRANYEIKNSMAITHSEIAKEWHPTKNGKLKPEHVSYGSNQKVWWVCPLGHSYDMPISERTISKASCPYCSGRRRLVGFNDLTTTHSHLLEEWDYEKNIKSPTEYSKGSVDKVFWKCKEGHSYQSSIYSRAQLKTGCPQCYKNLRNFAVICVETNEYFETGLDAAKKLGKDTASTIYKCCRGEVKSAFGLHWKFYEE